MVFSLTTVLTISPAQNRSPTESAISTETNPRVMRLKRKLEVPRDSSFRTPCVFARAASQAGTADAGAKDARLTLGARSRAGATVGYGALAAHAHATLGAIRVRRAVEAREAPACDADLVRGALGIAAATVRCSALPQALVASAATNSAKNHPDLVLFMPIVSIERTLFETIDQYFR